MTWIDYVMGIVFAIMVGLAVAGYPLAAGIAALIFLAEVWTMVQWLGERRQ